jgi:hypothetical protein
VFVIGELRGDLLLCNLILCRIGVGLRRAMLLFVGDDMLPRGNLWGSAVNTTLVGEGGGGEGEEGKDLHIVYEFQRFS